jgi:uncharacterized membrane protein YdjX (TVP38/TMEM64 family)
MARIKKKALNGYRFKNLTLLVISIIFAYFLFRNEALHGYLLHLGKYEYIGAFVSGLFFVSTFTIVPASIVLFILAETLPVWSIAFIAGAGAMLGDLTIFQFFRNDETDKEIFALFKQMGGRNLLHLLQTKHLRWTIPFIGALIIISPLPDELGVSLMGLSKLKVQYFLVLSYILNTIGVFLLLSASVIIKP